MLSAESCFETIRQAAIAVERGCVPVLLVAVEGSAQAFPV